MRVEQKTPHIHVSSGLPRHQFPKASFARLWLSGFTGALAGAACFGLGVMLLEAYGFVLFVLTPVVMGFVSGLTINGSGQYRARSVLIAGLLSMVQVGTGLLLFAFEGAICLLMAIPVAIPASLLGAALSLGITRRAEKPQHIFLFIALLMPAMLGAEAASVRYPVLPVITEIEIDAPPMTVWNHVIGFGDLPKPRETMFAAGIAYPVRARLEGEGVGAVRYCEFSTGPFVEPITVWEPGRRLAFDVSSQPEPMHELSPYRKIHAPHLLDGLESHRGEFLLTELPGGRTRLRGTTWYQVHMGPQWYWRSWSDHLIGGIHRRVLQHIKNLAEND